MYQALTMLMTLGSSSLRARDATILAEQGVFAVVPGRRRVPKMRAKGHCRYAAHSKRLEQGPQTMALGGHSKYRSSHTATKSSPETSTGKSLEGLGDYS